MTEPQKQNKAPLTGERLDTLKNCYRIHGDGIARLRLETATQHPKFQKSIAKLRNLELPKD